MPPNVFAHSLSTLVGLVLLWVLPWVAIFALAGAIRLTERRLSRPSPPPWHAPPLRHHRAA